jgi:hypothetical protein
VLQLSFVFVLFRFRLTTLSASSVGAGRDRTASPEPGAQPLERNLYIAAGSHGLPKRMRVPEALRIIRSDPMPARIVMRSAMKWRWWQFSLSAISESSGAGQEQDSSPPSHSFTLAAYIFSRHPYDTIINLAGSVFSVRQYPKADSCLHRTNP